MLQYIVQLALETEHVEVVKAYSNACDAINRLPYNLQVSSYTKLTMLSLKRYFDAFIMLSEKTISPLAISLLVNH
jgi:hypothetical protein